MAKLGANNASKKRLDQNRERNVNWISPTKNNRRKWVSQVAIEQAAVLSLLR